MPSFSTKCAQTTFRAPLKMAAGSGLGDETNIVYVYPDADTRRIQRDFPFITSCNMAVPADFFLDFYQMHTRNGGCAAIYRGRMYLWGGQTSRRTTTAEEFGSDSDDSDGEADAEEVVVPVNLPKEDDSKSVIDVYDIGDKLWWHCPTHGEVPRMGLGSRMCVFGESLYLYGGWNQYNFSSDLYRLDLSTYEWKMVALSNDVKPTPVYLTTMMVYEGHIITFGGVGLRVTAEKLEESGAEYHHFSNTPNPWGWNNEYHEFSIKDNYWTAYKCTNRPPPLSAMDMVMIDNHRAVLYGGRMQTIRSNRLFLINLQNREWLEPAPPPEDPAIPWPSIRVFHTLSCLHDPSTVGKLLYGQQVHQKVLLLGGKHEDAWISHEEWLLEIVEDRITWTKLDLGVKPPRSWHIACTHYPSMGQTEVFLFGGNVHIKPDEEERVDAADLRILTWGVARLSELSLPAAATLPDGHLQSLVGRGLLPAGLAETVMDHRRKMRIYKPHPIVLPE